MGEPATSSQGTLTEIYENEISAEESLLESVVPECRPDRSLPDDIDALIAILQEGYICERIFASRVLSATGDEAVLAVPALSANLSHEDFEVREAAAVALGKIGVPAIDALPQLVDRLRDTNYEVARQSARALAHLGSNLAVPALAAALYRPDRHNFNYLAREAAHSIETLTGNTFVEPPYQADWQNDDGIPYIVVHAREWWENEGKLQEWAGSVP